MSSILFNASCLLDELYINQRSLLFKGQGLLKGNHQRQRPNKCQRVAISIKFLGFHPRLLLWSGVIVGRGIAGPCLDDPSFLLEPPVLMVNLIFCCDFINCFFLNELNIRDTDFRLIRFYWVLERFVFYLLETNAVELRDFDTRIGTYLS